MKNSEREEYYEKKDFSEFIKSEGVKIGGVPKRITLNISKKIYDEANELDSYMRMGYQNVLKTAMTIGLTELYDQVSRHKVIKNFRKKSENKYRQNITRPEKPGSEDKP